VFLTTAISPAIIALGPMILAVVMAAAFLHRRRQRVGGLGDAGAARIIVAAAVLATALVTIGVLVFRR